LAISADDLDDATRVVLEDVWYSDALPEWYTPESVDANRTTHLVARKTAYLRGSSPSPAFHVEVPRINGGTRSWVMPPVNDQIIFHACVADLAPAVERGFDHSRIYSSAANDDANELAFLEPQLAAFTRFVNDTHARLARGSWVLEIDLLQAFRSVRVADFLSFVSSLGPGSEAAALVRKFTAAWTGGQAGIPFLNSSMFYLGNAYLRVADKVIDRFTRDYIRFADDYRIFVRSRSEGEAMFERISAALESVPMQINPRKVRLLSGAGVEPGLGLASAHREDAVHGEYIHSLVIDAGPVKDLTIRTLLKPDRYLNEGVGRLLLGAYRRFALDRAIAHRTGRTDNFNKQLASLLLADNRTIPLITDRLSYFAGHPGETWRTIWMIYLVEQLGQQQRFGPTLERIENDQRFAQAARLWARRCRLGKHGETAELADPAVDDLDYVQAGLHCYGQNLCTGDGF